MFYAISGCPVTKPASIHWSTWTPSFKSWPSKTHSFWSSTDSSSPRHPRKSQAKLLKEKVGPSNFDFPDFIRHDDVSAESCSLQSMAEMDVARKKLLMEFFAEHFIAMAVRSIEFNAYGQGNYYSRVLNEGIGTLKKKLHQKLEAVCKYFAVLAVRDLELQYFCKQKLSMNGTFIRDSRVL